MTRDDHLVGKKQRDHYQKSLREHVSAPTSAFAKAQLEKMGWSEGTGLGKRRDGIAEHIRVTRRQEQLGLGSSSVPEVVQAVGQTEWWKDSLGRTLAKLEGRKKEKKSKKRDKKDSKRKEQKPKKAKKLHYTDEELFEATGGARFGMRAGVTKNLHKWTRTEQLQAEGDNTDNKDGSTVAIDHGGADCEAEKKPRPLDDNTERADDFVKEVIRQQFESSIKAKRDKKENKRGREAITNNPRKGDDGCASICNEGTSPKISIHQQSTTTITCSSEENAAKANDAKAHVALEDDRSFKEALKKKRKAARKARRSQKKQRT